MRAQFVLSEIAVGLRRNLTMTIAAVVTVAVSLFLVGLALLVQAQVGTMKDFWYDRIQVSIFLTDGISAQQRDDIRSALTANPLVAHVFYETKQQAYERFTQQFRDTPDLIANVSPQTLPEAFRVQLKDPTQYDAITTGFKDRPGVDTVTNPRRGLDRLFSLLAILQWGSLAIAAISAVSAVLLIYNTVRVAAFSRRRETGIMRLVGASNTYIRLPFLLEGAIAGLLGAVVASGLIVGVQHFVVDERLRGKIPGIPLIEWGVLWFRLPLLVVAAVVLSAVASFFTLQRHLRV